MSTWKEKVQAGNVMTASWDTGRGNNAALGHDDYRYTFDEQNTPPCGTVGCIAGWTVMLTNGMDAFASRWTAAALLGIPHKDNDELFYVDNWANKLLKNSYLEAKTPQERATIVAQVIDEYIAKYKDVERTDE